MTLKLGSLSMQGGGHSNRGDMADQAIVAHERDLQVGLALLRNQDIREAAEARRREEEGTAKACKVCGNGISEARLKAKPFAIRCCECQRLYEDANPHVNLRRRAQ